MDKKHSSSSTKPDRQARQNGKREREELLKMCYNRLREMIPACTSETTLIKCIEMLEKQGAGAREEGSKEKRLYAIAETLDRLSELGEG